MYFPSYDSYQFLPISQDAIFDTWHLRREQDHQLRFLLQEYFPTKISKFISTISQKLIEIGNIDERLMRIHL
jgi:hypothetical protein